MSQSASAHVGKKAVHVKWAGKTIALGTFPTAEADDKCARAKALTRAWRSTMRPKPSREWVMLELERLNVRVVSGRVAQKEGSTSDSDNGDDDSPAVPSRVLSNNNSSSNNNSIATSALAATQQQQHQQQLAAAGLSSADQDLLNLNHHRRNSITASLLNVADLARGGVGGDRRNSLASLDSSFFFNRQGSLSLAPNMNLNVNAPPAVDSAAGEKRDAPPARPYVGGGSAAAYEATREDHYRKIAERRKMQKKDGGGSNVVGNHAANNLAGGRASLGGTAVGGLANDVESLGALNQIGAGIGGMNQQTNMPSSAMSMPSNANQHYEMLKLHHMNLLNEIQETNLMMNLYQQQQLQQQLQQDQLNSNRFVDPQLSLLSQQQQLLAGTSGLGQAGRGLGQANASLGLGQASLGLGQAGLGLGQASAGLGLGQANGGLGLGQTSIGSLGLGSLMGQQNALSQVGGLVANDLGIPHRRSSSGNNSSVSNNNSMMNNSITDSISNGIKKGINNNSSNIAASSDSNPTHSPSRKLSSSVNKTNVSVIVKRKDIDEASAANAHDSQLQRIKDEIAERQRMVDELERMEPKQKRSKVEHEI